MMLQKTAIKNSREKVSMPGFYGFMVVKRAPTHRISQTGPLLANRIRIGTPTSGQSAGWGESLQKTSIWIWQFVLASISESLIQ